MREILELLGERLRELEEEGLTDTEDYEQVSDEYQALAQDLVLADMFEVWEEDESQD